MNYSTSVATSSVRAGRVCCALVAIGATIAGLASVAIPTAAASQLISTSSVTNLTLGVNDKGQAMVTYTSNGETVHVLASGAVNALTPAEGAKQLDLTLQYDGGYSTNYAKNPAVMTLLTGLRTLQRQMSVATAAKNNPLRYTLKPRIAADFSQLSLLRAAASAYSKTFACPAYDGPTLAWEITACKAPDGSYWAIQEWQRKLPDYGIDPTPVQASMEVHLAHWTGALPVLTIQTNWAYKRFDHLFGSLTYAGTGVFGYASTASGAPLDSWGRNIYVDSFDSSYGAGWYRVNSFLTHKQGGSFCYGFYPHRDNLTGAGQQYRATVIGPGLTPDIMWQGQAPGPYDTAVQTEANKAIVALNDPQCRQV